MKASVKGFLLDEQIGDFVSDDGKKISYHNARFYDTENSSLFKAQVPDGVSLPEPQIPYKLEFTVNAGERYCKLAFSSYSK